MWRKMKKKMIKSSLSQGILSLLVVFYLIIVRWTCRFRIHGLEHVRPYWREGKPVIIVFWHGRIALAPFAWDSSVPFLMLISPHSDGQLIARIIRFFGLKTLFGSSSHDGGPKILRQVIQQLRQGVSIGITPDGPRGPRHIPKAGVFLAAYTAQCDVIPLSFATSHYKQLSSWDRFFLPLPLGRGHAVYGAPILAPQCRSDQRLFLAQISQSLQESTERAQALCGEQQ